MKVLRSLHKSNPEIPTSTFSDIAFLLIIFFLLTTVISVSRGIPFAIPDKSNNGVDAQHGIHIFIDDRANIYLDGEESSLADIKPYCREKLTANPNKPVIIQCHPAQRYQGFITTLDKVKQLEKSLYKNYNKNLPRKKWKRINIYIPSIDEFEVK